MKNCLVGKLGVHLCSEEAMDMIDCMIDVWTKSWDLAFEGLNRINSEAVSLQPKAATESSVNISA